MEILSKKALLRLRFILEKTAKLLEKEWKWNTMLLGEDMGIPIPILVADLGSAKIGAVSNISLMFVPTGMEDKTHTVLLQFYAQLYEGQIPAEKMKALEALLPRINIQLPLGYFGLKDDKEVYFRYILPIPQYAEPDEELLSETIRYYLFSLQTFEPEIAKIL